MCGELKVGTLQEKQLSLATEPLAVWPLALFHSGVTFLGENQMWLCKDTQVALRRGPQWWESEVPCPQSHGCAILEMNPLTTLAWTDSFTVVLCECLCQRPF